MVSKWVTSLRNPRGQARVLGTIMTLPGATRLIAAGTRQTGWEKLDGPTRAKVLAAITGLVILGFAMILLTWLGARVTRRYMRSGVDRGKRRAIPTDDWAHRPISSPEEGNSQEENV